VHHSALRLARAYVGWATFKAAERLVRLASVTLGLTCPLGHVTGDLAESMHRVNRDAAF
jgi:hypothetical protein